MKTFLMCFKRETDQLDKTCAVVLERTLRLSLMMGTVKSYIKTVMLK